MFKIKIILALLLVAFADWLFYQQPIGWTLALYAAVLLIVLISLNRRLLNIPANKIIALLTLGLIGSLIESPQMLNVGLTSLALVSLIIVQKQRSLPNTLLYLEDIARFLDCAWQQSYRDSQKFEKITKRRPVKILPLRYVALPLSMALLFIWLFSLANPVIAQVLEKIDWDLTLHLMSPLRWLFWLTTAIMIWALVRPHYAPSSARQFNTNLDLSHWLNQQTLLWSLILFNTLFAVQNALDMVFLWSGQTLPNGLTYAEYAHAGAYPLFIISLITAAYVLIVFNEQQNTVAKRWVFLWLAQTVVLLMSAIWRLHNYIEIYSLTHLRIAAFLGMLLTAIGLTLILFRIYSNRNNLWLINGNAFAVILTLYVLCFVNLNSIIANYNVRHCLEVTGTGNNIDLTYLEQLGTNTLPALRWFQSHAQYSPELSKQAGLIINDLEQQLLDNNWRTWTWRKQRINSVLTTKTTTPLQQGVWQYQ